MWWTLTATRKARGLQQVMGLLALVFFYGVAPASAADVTATEARVSGDQTQTRFTADLSAPVSYTVYVLPDPYRVLIDAPALRFDMPPGTGRKGQGLVNAFRYGQVDPGRSRIVMDVKGPVLITKSFLQPAANGQPARLIVDLVPTSAQAFVKTYSRDADTNAAAVAGARTGGDHNFEVAAQTAAADDTEQARQPLAMPQPAAAPPESQEAAPRIEKMRRLIVIDPGHGGIDPGAIGVTGRREKDVTLAFGKALRDVLSASGQFDVVMTRGDDRFITLEDRAKLAHDKAADLFIAIHADTVRGHDAHGATIYTLSDKASDAEAEALAQKENRADLIAGIDLGSQSQQVTDILINLAQRESKKRSVVFARKAASEMKAVTGFTGKPLRSAGFVVLKAPDVPSVLVELGYLSSKPDEAQLGNDVWRSKVASAIGRAVNQYFTSSVAATGP